MLHHGLSFLSDLVAQVTGREEEWHQSLLQTPLPAPWGDFILNVSPLISKLSTAQRQRLEGLILLFLDTVTFEGHDGFEVTDEMRITVAAQACLLLVNRPQDQFKALKKIILHADDFQSADPRAAHDEVYDQRIGEAWTDGRVILSWADAQADGWSHRDGHNVVLHELAHQLDNEYVTINGRPKLSSVRSHRDWNTLMETAYQEFIQVVARGEFTPLNPYAAKSRAEFFAVTSEAFFEQPEKLKVHYPKVYERLANFYGERLDTD